MSIRDNLFNCYKYQEKLTMSIDTYCSNIDDTIRCNNNYYQDSIANFEKLSDQEINERSDHMKNFNNEHVLYENQIKTAIDLYLDFITNPTKNKNVLGAMQSGKTGTMMATALFTVPMLHLRTDKKYVITMLLSNKVSHYDDTMKQFKAHEALLGNIEFSYNNKKISYNEYYNKIGISPKDLIIKRSKNKKDIDKYKKLIKKLKNDGFIIITLIDESHWGQGEKSMMETIIGDEMVACTADQNSPHTIVCFSATPFNTICLKNFTTTKQHLGEKFSGLNFMLGEVIDPTSTIKEPTVISLSTLGEEISYDSTKISSRAYKNFNTFNKKYSNCFDNHAAYKEYFEEFVVKSAEHVLVDGTDEKKQVVMRTFTDNKTNEEFMNKVKLKLNGNIDIISYYGDNSKENIKDLIDNSPKNKILVFVTGQGRMADVFPNTVTLFIDFTEKYSTQAAMLQGLIGRACGYNKNSKVAVSDTNSELFQKYKIEEGKLVTRPCNGVKAVSNSGFHSSRSKSLIIDVNKHENDPIIQPMINDLNNAVHTVYGKCNNLGDATEERIFNKNIFNEERMKYLEKKYDCPLLRFDDGDTDAEGKQYRITGDMVEFSGRSADVTSGGARIKTQSTIRSAEKNNAVRYTYVQLTVHPDTSGFWKLTHIQLQLKEPKKITYPAISLPKLNTFGDYYMTDEEREKAA